jgi:CelD/BcsL family acetyltransferase involved in cellulose biosynthesis
VAKAFLKRGWLDLAFLCLDGQPIAFHFGFRYRRRYYYYIPAFDPSCAAYAPSTQLLVRLMRKACEEGFEVFDFLIGNEPACEEGFEVFDFLIGNEPYKYDWATENHLTAKLVFPLHQGWRNTTTALAVGRERLIHKAQRSHAVRRVVKPILGWWQGFNA